MNFIIVMDAGCQIIVRYQMHRAIAICCRIPSYSDKFKYNFNIGLSIKNYFFHTITAFFLLYHKKEITVTLYQDYGCFLVEIRGVEPLTS